MNHNRTQPAWVRALAVAALTLCTAAVVAPAIGVGTSASRPTCLANMRQLALGIAMYCEDNNGYLPSIDTGYPNPPSEPSRSELFCGHAIIESEDQAGYVRADSIRSRISPYVRGTLVWLCPADGECNPNYAKGVRWSSYHYRLYIAAAPNLPCPRKRYRARDFEHADLCYILHETVPFHDLRTSGKSPDGMAQWDAACKMNFAFLDWHVKPVEVGKIVRKVNYQQGWDYHWPRDLQSAERGIWTCEAKDIASMD